MILTTEDAGDTEKDETADYADFNYEGRRNNFEMLLLLRNLSGIMAIRLEARDFCRESFEGIFEEGMGFVFLF